MVPGLLYINPPEMLDCVFGHLVAFGRKGFIIVQEKGPEREISFIYSELYDNMVWS